MKQAIETNRMNRRPIGILDTGPGGLAVAKELRRLLPGEEILYYCMTPLPEEAPRPELLEAVLTRLLWLQQEVKAVFLASGLAGVALEGQSPEALGICVPCLDLVHSVARAACGSSAQGRIGVIAETDVIHMGAYAKAIHSVQPGARVAGSASPLLTPLAEEGKTSLEDPGVRGALEQYLAPLARERIDALLVGSAAFTPLSGAINELLRYKVTLVEPGTAAARDLEALLTEEGLLADRETAGEIRCLVEQGVTRFRSLAKIYLGSAAGCTAQRIPARKRV